MIHFGPKFNTCLDRRRRDSKSNAIAIEGFQYMQRQHPESYCARCAGVPSRTDSDRYAELRALVEAVQIDSKLGTARAALDALLDWRHR